MPKLTIEITEKAHLVLKERAKSEERSLTQYITLLLDEVSDVRHLLKNPFPNSETPTTLQPDIQSIPHNNNSETPTTQPPRKKTRIDAPATPSRPQSEPQPLTSSQLTESERRSRQKSFTDLSKEILGHPLMETDYSLTPDNLYYPYAEEVEGKFLRYADTMPYEKQIEYLEEYKHYDK